MVQAGQAVKLQQLAGKYEDLDAKIAALREDVMAAQSAAVSEVRCSALCAMHMCCQWGRPWSHFAWNAALLAAEIASTVLFVDTLMRVVNTMELSQPAVVGVCASVCLCLCLCLCAAACGAGRKSE